MPLTTLTATVDAESTGRADAVVRALCETSHSQVRGMFDRGCVTINGEPCDDSGTQVVADDVVAVRYDPTQRYREIKKKRSWDDRAFEVIFEDEHLIVVDKAAGTLTVPTESEERNALSERVSVYISHSRRSREAHVVHRLDRAVSGLLVFGKHEAVAEALIEQFKSKKPDRVYCAIVAGVMKGDDEGVFESRIVKGNRSERRSKAAAENAEVAVTQYKILQRFQDTTLVEAVLQTGIRNQLRVHFTHAGHPVLGDPRYDADKATHPRWVRKRIALHAKKLGFIHPATGEEVVFDSPLPPAMKKFVNGSR